MMIPNDLIISFILDKLDTPDIDHGERLVKALTKLASVRPEVVLPVICRRIALSSGRALRRLIMVLQCLSDINAEPLIPYQYDIAQLLEKKDFFYRQSALKILRSIEQKSELDDTIYSIIGSINRVYSSKISSSSYRLHTSPSDLFIAFLQRHTLYYFMDQIKSLEKVLSLPANSIIAAIEKKLQDQSWSMKEDLLRSKDDWDGFVHPQGWPVVWITTQFQELATKILWSTLNEAVENFKIRSEQIERLWLIVQAVDPEYVSRFVIPRPADILPLEVTDKDAWFDDLDKIEPYRVAENDTKDWITVFEKRIMAQEISFNVPFRQELILKSCLIPPQVYGGFDRLDEVNFISEKIVPESAMAVTVKQAKDILLKRDIEIPFRYEDSLPLIAEHRNPTSFMGYLNICSLASFIIKALELSFEGFDLTKGKKVVTRYEAWQEGYQDETYTREKLSYGIRLLVRRELLAEICSRYRKVLCININEKRAYFSSIHHPEADETRNSERFVLMHLAH